ncbi:MFS transporter [Paenibacillus sp. BR2-3]|uniref:MFS transporter n=1 Tax=Paenibacillus sp. BR2-3 TaxID=3048494 RepID=UPI003977C3C7
MNKSSCFQRNFQVLWMGQFFSICSLTVMVPFLPFLMTELGAVTTAENLLWAGLSLAAPAYMLCLVSPIWGRYGDRFGKKLMVVRALLGIAVSLGLMGWAQTPLQFFLARLLQGAFGGVVDATAAFTGSQANERTQGRVLGSLQSATAAGSLIGPLIGGTMADLFGFQTLLWWMALLTGLSGLGAAILLREPHRETASNREVNISLVKACSNLLRHRRVRSFLLAGMMAQFGAFGLVTVFAPRVEGMIGYANYAATWVGVLQAITWGATLIGSPWWGRRNDRMQIEKNVCLALVGCGLSVILQALPPNVVWLIPLRIVQGFCFGALIQSIFLVVIKESKKEHRGMNIGIANSFLVIGQIAGSLLGAAFGAFLTMEWTFVIIGSSFLCGSVWLAIGARQSVSAPYIKTIMMRWKMKDDKQY